MAACQPRDGRRSGSGGRGEPCRAPARRRAATLNAYLDTSVLVALLTEDALSERADALLQRHDPAVMVSDLARAEFASVMALRVRTQRMDESAAREAFAKLDAWVAAAALPAKLENGDVLLAERFLRRLDMTLRTQDAMHIALALRLGASLATFDARMAGSARGLGAVVLEG
ncbi:type II toxin-antitoxin system VapC family toxin [Roseomonas sp. AR75]|uniref:type II toxin-antitoxin system VapC family toxin n=1 Tax=Roseomonas sp. AR75 TaxID=2562311 RepID=UPI00198009FF|nr:type II toxin-antitoxin system VapC family toxin [Roseomonas sp. AR75]